jgi:vacuolar-type H+-ATPase catalytic subunit A/Vma1
VVKAKGLHGCTMQEMVKVGYEELLGEAVKLGGEGKAKGDDVTIQVYEQTGMDISTGNSLFAAFTRLHRFLRALQRAWDLGSR